MDADKKRTDDIIKLLGRIEIRMALAEKNIRAIRSAVSVIVIVAMMTLFAVLSIRSR